jgi:hypothetical protein
MFHIYGSFGVFATQCGKEDPPNSTLIFYVGQRTQQVYEGSKERTFRTLSLIDFLREVLHAAV